MTLRRRRFLGSTDTVVASVTIVMLGSSTFESGDTVLLQAIARNAAGHQIAGKKATWVSDSAHATVPVGPAKNETVSLVSDGVAHITATIDTVASAAYTITVSTSSAVDPLIQGLIDGDYDGAPARVYEIPNGFKTDVTKRLMGTWTLDTPAAPSGNLVDPTHITLDLVSATIATSFAGDPSLAATPKMLVVDEDGAAPIYLSAGPAGSVAGGDPDVILPNADVASGDDLTLASVTAAAVDDPFDHIEVTPSGLALDEAEAFTIDAQLLDVGDAPVRRIGVDITLSLVNTSGLDGGSLDDTVVSTNALGESETASAHASDYPSTDHVHAVAGTKTGNSSDIVINAPPPPTTYYNLRATLPFVTDDADSVGVIPADTLPTVRNGRTFGVVRGPGNFGGDRDRKADNPPQLAGFWSDADAIDTYMDLVVDLTSHGGPGMYKIGCSFGDPFTDPGGFGRVRIYDDTALLEDIEMTDTYPGTYVNQFRDLADNKWDVAAWVASQVPVEVPVATSTLVVRLGQATSGPTGHTWINCVSVQRTGDLP